MIDTPSTGKRIQDWLGYRSTCNALAISADAFGEGDDDHGNMLTYDEHPKVLAALSKAVTCLEANGHTRCLDEIASSLGDIDLPVRGRRAL